MVRLNATGCTNGQAQGVFSFTTVHVTTGGQLAMGGDFVLDIGPTVHVVNVTIDSGASISASGLVCLCLLGYLTFVLFTVLHYYECFVLNIFHRQGWTNSGGQGGGQYEIYG